MSNDMEDTFVKNKKSNGLEFYSIHCKHENKTINSEYITYIVIKDSKEKNVLFSS